MWLVQRRGHRAKEHACPYLYEALVKRLSPRSLEVEDEAFSNPKY